MAICYKQFHGFSTKTALGNGQRLFESVAILLEYDQTDLQIWIGDLNRYVCCTHVTEEFAEQLRVRHEALKQKAVKHLTQFQRHELKLNTLIALDNNAQVVANILHEKGVISSFGEYGVSCDPSYRSSVYHHLARSEEADISLEKGFQDVSVCDHMGSTPLVTAAHTNATPRDQGNQYLDWLIEHGASLFSPFSRPSWIRTPLRNSSDPYRYEPALNTKSAHHVADCLRRRFQYSIEGRLRCTSIVLASDAVDTCSCGCSSRGCDPSTILFRELCDWTEDCSDLPKPLRDFLDHLDADASPRWISSAIRVLTFEALGLTHTCCKKDNSWSDKFLTRYEKVDLDEMRIFESDHLQLLKSLVDEFQAKLDESTADGPLRTECFRKFLSGYWLERMNHKLEKRRQGRTWEQETQEALQMGVRCYDQEVSLPKVTNKNLLSSMGFLVEELDRIMAGKPTVFCLECRHSPCEHYIDFPPLSGLGTV